MLPDVTQLASSAPLLRALGGRLRAIGLDTASVRPITAICERFDDDFKKFGK